MGPLGRHVDEFKSTVKALHRAGIEVILDVVYNHPAEGDQMGPTVSLRGIDNLAYYRLRRDNPRHYENATGRPFAFLAARLGKPWVGSGVAGHDPDPGEAPNYKSALGNGTEG